MERGAYRESLEVLRDSIMGMQKLSKLLAANDTDEEMEDDESCSSNLSNPTEEGDQQELLRASVNDMHKAIRLTASVKSRPSVTEISPLQVLSDDAGFGAIQLIQQQQNPTRFPTCHPIRIEDMSESRNFDLDAGIVLCNFATAHLCQSRLALANNNERDAGRLREGAYSIGCVAFQRLSSLILCDDHIVNGEGPHFQDQVRCDTAIFLATMASLKTLVLVSRESGRPQEAKESFQRLLYLVAAVDDASSFDACTISAASAA